MILRDYQLEGLEAIRTELQSGCQRQLIVMATGLGKTVVFSQVPQLNPGQTLVLAHREELLYQAGRKIQESNPNLYISVEQADKRAHPDSDVILASVATIGRLSSTRITKFKNVKNLIIDEAHHASASTYQNVIHCLGFGKESIKDDPERLLLGVTATPKRSDNIGLEHTFDKIVFNKDIRYGIEQGYLVDINAFKIKTNTSLDGIASQGGDFKEGQLAERVDNDDRNVAIVRGYIDHALGLKTIVFCAGVDHVIHITDLFKAEGVRAELVIGSTDKFVRRRVIDNFNNGDTDVLVGCGVFTEGFDSPIVKCIVQGRPTKSQPLYIQMMGRGTRPYVDLSKCVTAEDRLAAIALSSKPTLKVLDVVDNTTRHSPVMVPALFGLNEDIKLTITPAFKVVKEIEEALRQAPNLDVTKIKDPAKIKQMVTQALKVNIWDSIAVAKEVKENSRFAWQKWNDGSFHISLDKHETMVLKENTLGQWDAVIETTADWNGNEWKKREATYEHLGQELSASDIFARSDRFIEANYPDLCKVILQNAKWHKDDASEKQFALLLRYKYPVFRQEGRMYISDEGTKIPLTKGLAGKLITKKISGFQQQHASNRTRVSNS